MAKRKARPPIQAAPKQETKSFVTVAVPSNPDVKKDDLNFLGLAIDPVEEYHRQTDLFVRREIVWNLYRRCSAVRTISNSVASEIAAQEMVITPTEANPSATTILLAKRGIDLVNNAMNRPGGVVDFIVNLIDSYWGSKTGAFILTPRDSHGNILALGILPPNIPRPFYGYTADGSPDFFSNSQNLNLADGIWFIERSLVGANYFALPADQYFQLCYGSLGYGAFQDGEPVAEQQLSPIVTHIALSDYMRKTTMATDTSQIILLNNVDTKEFIAKSNLNKELAMKRRNGIPINPEDEGNRMVATARDLDKPASITIANLHAFPADFDPEAKIVAYEQRIALGFGVHPRRAAADIQKERFGNAAQASMLNTDEPGVKVIKSMIQYFIGSVLLSGVPVRAEFLARNTPENYWAIDRDAKAANVVAQLGANITPEMAQSYLVRQGVLEPRDINQTSIRAEDGVPVARGWVTLRDRIGHILTYDSVNLLDMPTQSSYVTSSQKSVVASEFQPCADAAIARYEEWIRNELPTTVVEQNGSKSLSYYGLRQEVDDIAVEVYHDLVQCAKRNGAKSSDSRVRDILDNFRSYFYNLFGSPALQQFADKHPKTNLFNDLWFLSGALALGTSDIADMQSQAAKYVPILSRYANATRAAVYMAAGLAFKGTGGVDWVLGEVENHCGMCPAFARHYDSFAEMISHTGGLLPGDVRLQCSGNCKCHLDFHP